jgi:hypothetical protein
MSKRVLLNVFGRHIIRISRVDHVRVENSMQNVLYSLERCALQINRKQIKVLHINQMYVQFTFLARF